MHLLPLETLLPNTYAETLILFLPHLLTVAFARQCFLHALLFTRFQVKRMTLHFLDDVLCLDLALEAAQGILKRFTFLNTYFCQD
jgi:hypothetical protein